MPRADLEKATVRLNRGDKDELSALFPNVGYNKVIRALVHNFLKSVKERALQNLPARQMQGTLDISEIMTTAESQDE